MKKREKEKASERELRGIEREVAGEKRGAKGERGGENMHINMFKRVS